MKKIYFVFCCPLLLLCCAKKTAPLPQSSLSASINDAVTTFNANILVLKDSSDSGYTLSVVGFQGAFGDTGAVGFEIMSPVPITTGKYTTDSAMGTQVSLIYNSIGGLEYNTDSAYAYSPPEVSITALTKLNVQGTFGGTVVLPDSTSAVTKIEAGLFNIYFKQ